MEYTQELYPAYCTECGKKIETRLFPLDGLLKQYHYTGILGAHRDGFLDMVRIHAEYGKAVLPQVPPLVKNGEYQSPDLEKLAGSEVPPTFSCADNDIPTDQLMVPALSIASMIAQFYQISGFDEIYKMLALVWEKRQAMNALSTFPAEQQNILDGLCDKFIALPYVHMRAMSVDTAALHNDVETALGWVLDSAVQEELEPGKLQFSLSTIKIGWRYKTLNNREVPHSLVVVDGSSRHDCTVCCCKHCFKPILKELGAYPQKIIGLLGSQQTGKTTYLAALTDSLVHGNIAAAMVSGELKLANVTFEFQADEEGQEPLTPVAKARPAAGVVPPVGANRMVPKNRIQSLHRETRAGKCPRKRLQNILTAELSRSRARVVRDPDFLWMTKEPLLQTTMSSKGQTRLKYICMTAPNMMWKPSLIFLPSMTWQF